MSNERYSKEPDHFIIFDLEWNMASDNTTVPQEIRESLPYEIIEIGAVKLDRNGRQLDRFQAFIKPEVYQKLNRYVARVTNRAVSSLKSGLAFPEVMKRFYDFCQENYAFCTWSDSDSKPLKENLAFHNMDDRLSVRVLNVQSAFSQIFEPGTAQRSIEYALDFLRIPKKQPFHQAVSDAGYTGEVLREILISHEAEKEGLEPNVVREISSDTIYDLMDRCSYNPDIRLTSQIQLAVPPVQADMENELNQPMDAAAFNRLGNRICFQLNGQAFNCPACDGRLAAGSDDWKQVGRHYQRMLQCREHGDVLCKGKARKNKEGKLFIHINLRIQKS